MSKPSAKSSSDAAPPKLVIQRLRLDAQGYDATGSYWGAGSDVFIATTPDGAEEVTVRARSVVEARAKAAAEIARKPGVARAEPRQKIGGASPHKSRHEIAWHDPITGQTVRIRITHSRDYLGQGQDHIEVESIAPKRAPLPITNTGYRSHFLPALELINAGGPVTFVTAWIEREAGAKAWRAAVDARAQGDLFQWADAQAEVGVRRPAKARKPSAPAAKPCRKRPRDRTPG